MNIIQYFSMISLVCLVSSAAFGMNNQSSKKTLQELKECGKTCEAIGVAVEKGDIKPAQAQEMLAEQRVKSEQLVGQAYQQINNETADRMAKLKKDQEEKKRVNDEKFQALLASLKPKK